MSQSQLARRIGTGASQISMIENGQSGTSNRTMAAAASALNVSLDYLAGLTDEPRAVRELVYTLRKTEARNHDLEQGKRHIETYEYDEYMVRIPVMEFQTGAGGGYVIQDEGVESNIEFPMRWLRERGLRPDGCRIHTIVGESMEPTLADGCPILVDYYSTSRRSQGIYVLLTEDGVVVKRAVHNRKAGWLMVSDNADRNRFPAQPWPEDARVIGEVKWHGQSFK